MCLMGWEGAGGEAVFSVFDGVAGCGWRGGVQCVLMGWQGASGEAVFSMFNRVAGCRWRGGVQCV